MPVSLPVDCSAPLFAVPLNDEEAVATAAVFSALANPTRVRLVNLLSSSEVPVCLCHLTGPVGLAQATVSAHLRKLVDTGLVVREERGKWSYFSINAKAFKRVATLAEMTDAGRAPSSLTK